MYFKVFLAFPLLSLYIGLELTNSAISPTFALPLNSVQGPPIGTFDEDLFSHKLLTEKDVNFVLSRSGRSVGAFRSNANRRIRGSSSRIVLYRFWRPTVISETVSSEMWEGSEAVMDFLVPVIHLKNVTKAVLNLTLLEPSLNLPLTLLASAASVSSNPSPQSESFTTVGTIQPNSEDNRVSFDVLSFVRSYIHNYTTAAEVSNESSFSGPKIRLVFQVRGQCNTVDRVDCQQILDIGTRVPFLKVDYTNKETSDDIDQILSSRQ